MRTIKDPRIPFMRTIQPFHLDHMVSRLCLHCMMGMRCVIWVTILIYASWSGHNAHETFDSRCDRNEYGR